tara:strand:- start:146 stop:829 length:684 start_codon:yes stop_codon:yes gene_type:complete
MKYLLFFLLCSSVVAQDRYKAITDRNAFALLNEVPKKDILPPVVIRPPVKLNLTGIITRRGVTNVYLFSKDIPKRFLTLSTLRRTDSGITLLSVEKGLVEVDNNGTVELISFDTHKLPTVVTLPALKATPTVVKKKDSKDKNKEVKITPAAPKPNVVTVPSRTPKVDPRIIQKGLEYIDRIEDKEKREYILQRLERLQSGQQKLDSKIDSNERRRQYDERRRSDKRN